MKTKSIILLLSCIVLLSSCTLTREQRIERRRDRKCELASYRWGCDFGRDTAYILKTETKTIYRDTTVYIHVPGAIVVDSVPVYVQVGSNGSVKVSTPVNTLETSMAVSRAWIDNGRLRHELVQRDSVFRANIDNAIRITQTLMKESTIATRHTVERYVPMFWRVFGWIGIVLSSVIIVILIDTIRMRLP